MSSRRDTEEQVVSQIRQLVLSLKTAEEFANSQPEPETARRRCGWWRPA